MSIDTTRRQETKSRYTRASCRYTSDMMQFMITQHENEGKKKKKKNKPPTLHVQWSAIRFIQWHFKLNCDCCVMKTLSNVINLEWLRRTMLCNRHKREKECEEREITRRMNCKWMIFEVCVHVPVKTKQQQQQNSRVEIGRSAGWLERHDRPQANGMHDK